MVSQASYDQRTGRFIIYGEVDDGGQERVLYEAQGYAGRGAGKNNPDAEHIRSVGPIPKGAWVVGRPHHHERLGALAFPLYRDDFGPTFGRSGFYIHGDSRKNPGNASSGCIILNRRSRTAVLEFAVKRIHVCASEPETKLRLVPRVVETDTVHAEHRMVYDVPASPSDGAGTR